MIRAIAANCKTGTWQQQWDCGWHHPARFWWELPALVLALWVISGWIIRPPRKGGST